MSGRSRVAPSRSRLVAVFCSRVRPRALRSTSNLAGRSSSTTMHPQFRNCAAACSRIRPSLSAFAKLVTVALLASTPIGIALTRCSSRWASAAEAEHTARIFLSCRHRFVAVGHVPPVVEYGIEGDEVDLGEVFANLGDAVHTVGVEAHAGPTDGHRQVQRAAWCKDTRKFCARQLGALRFERITVTSEPDMFDNMQT